MTHWPGLFLFSCLALLGCADVEDESQLSMVGSNDGTPVSIVFNAAGECDLAYSPNLRTVPVNTKITWTNDDLTPHTVTSSDGLGCGPDNAMAEAVRELDSPLINPAGMYSHTFNAPGTYPYVCTILGHEMSGSIIVEEEIQAP
jgi:plastocyanin